MKKLLNYIKNSKKYEMKEIKRLEKSKREMLELSQNEFLENLEYYCQNNENIEESKRLINFYNKMIDFIEEYASENDLEY